MSAHTKYVQKLYKRSLKLVNDWYWQLDEARAKSLIIRKMFEDNRNLTSQQEIISALKLSEHLLALYAHPQPYIRPTAPGGTKWERNLPFPQELCERGSTPVDNC